MVTIIGGGIIGLAVGWRCVQQGLDVTIFDSGTEDGAWYAAAGMLAPAGEAGFGQDALTELSLESARRWPEFAAELQQESGMTLGFDDTGTLNVALTSDDLAEVARLSAYRKGLGVETLRPAALRELEPALSPRVRGGARAGADRQVDPRRVVRALRVVLGDAVVRREVSEIPEGVVVVAAGVGTAKLTGLPVRPVKGLVLRLRGEPGVLRHVVQGWADGRHVYLVPRADGEVVVGATQEERSDELVTAGAVLELLRGATDLVPELGEFALVETVVRHRPATPDNAPLLGRLRDDVFVAAGHHRNGVLLAPVTADLIAGLVSTGEAAETLDAFAPGRFA